MFRRCATYFLATVFSLLLALVAVEIAVRTFLPQTNRAMSVNTWDPDLGMVQVPGMKGFAKTTEFDVELVINSHGMRDREFAVQKPAGTRRVLSLGDSFAAGYGVAAQSTFAKDLERRLARSSAETGTEWEVLNAGVGSTGTAHQLAYLEDVGFSFEPDIVLLGFFPGNDYTDNVKSGLYSLENQTLQRHRIPRSGGRRVQEIVNRVPGSTWWFARSHLLNWLKWQVSHRHWTRQAERAVASEIPEEQTRFRVEMTHRLLVEIAKLCDQREIPLLVHLVASDRPADSPLSNSALLTFLDTAGIASLDLAPKLIEDPGKPIYTFPLDRHWNERGHAVVGQALFERLTELHFLD